MARNIIVNIYKPASKKTPGVHAKTNTSKLKSSKNYVKLYHAQVR